jgi:hypothetical protein
MADRKLRNNNRERSGSRRGFECHAFPGSYESNNPEFCLTNKDRRIRKRLGNTYKRPQHAKHTSQALS